VDIVVLPFLKYLNDVHQWSRIMIKQELNHLQITSYPELSKLTIPYRMIHLLQTSIFSLCFYYYQLSTIGSTVAIHHW